MDISVIVSNPLINVGVLSWALAQLIKAVIDFFRNKHFSKKRLIGAGGMPSSHAAVTSSVCLMSFLEYGFNSPIFALSFILMFIVLYDSMGVRRAAGLHAKAINNIVDYLEEAPDKNEKTVCDNLQALIPKLNESLGHRVIEVICGVALGSLMALFFKYVLNM